MTPDELLKYYYNMETIKEQRKSLMNDVNSFFSPDDLTYTGSQKIGLNQVEKGELLDTTGSDLLKEFVSYTLGLFFDQERRWFSIAVEGYEDNPEVKRALEQHADILFKCIGRTNYYAEAPMYDWDTLVHGHAVMVIEQDKENWARCRTKNPVDVLFDADSTGKIRTVSWPESFSYMDILREFPFFKEQVIGMGVKEKDYDKTIGQVEKHIEIITMYQEVDANIMTPEELEKFKGYKYVRRYVIDLAARGLKGIKSSSMELEKWDGFKENIIFPVRDEPTREHPYGNGKGKIVLPKARILNRLAADMLNLSNLKANPPLMMTADLAREMNLVSRRSRVKHGFVEDLPIKPGSVYIFDVEKLEETRGRPVEVIDISGKLEETMALYQEVREQTAELLPIAGQVYKVARQSISEINQRTEQQTKRLAPLRANYTKEGLSKHLKRFYNLAKRAGKFKDVPLPDEVDDRQVQFIFDAFLLQTKRISDSLRLTQSLNLVSQYMLAKPAMADWIDGNKIMNGVFEANGVLKYLLPPEAVEQIRRQTQEEAQRQAEIQQAQVDGPVIKAVSDSVGNLLRE